MQNIKMRKCQMNNEIKILDQIVAVNLNVNIWSAKTKLRPEDFNHAELPPEYLASLGSKKVCDPKDLRIFGTLKARAVSLLDKHGIRFLGGWAIPVSRSAEIHKDLEEIAKEFELSKDVFMSSYDSNVQNWIKQNPGWEQIIADSIVSKDYVASKIAFNWQMFRVINPTSQKDDALSSGLTSEVGYLPTVLFDDIAKTARDAFAKSYDGKSEVTRKALAPLKNIYQKLVDLSFIDKNVVPVGVLIQKALDRVPSRGAISGDLLIMLKGLMKLISDTTVITHTAKNIKKGVLDYDGVLDSFVEVDLKQKAAKVKSRKSVDSHGRVSEPKPKSEPKEGPQAMQLDSMGLW